MLIFFTTLTAAIGSAQNINFDWATQITGPQKIDGHAVVTDKFGNVYTTGSYGGTADLDPGAGTLLFSTPASEEIYISKQDSSGNLIWANHMPGNIFGHSISIDLDNAGNIYITGNFRGSVDFDPGPAIETLSTEGAFGSFVAKYNDQGNFIWAKQFGGLGASGITAGKSLTVDYRGNILVTGIFTNAVDFDPGPGAYMLYPGNAGSQHVFIVKLSNDGQFIWARNFGGASSTCSGFGIKTDKSGNVYTTGTFQGSAIDNKVDFDPGPQTYFLLSTNIRNIFVSKLSETGNFVWAKQMVSNSSGESNSITVDDAGNVLATGYFSGTTDFDPGPAIFNLVASTELAMFVSKLNAAGKFIWAKKITGTDIIVGNSIKADRFGNVYVTGYFTADVDFDPGPTFFILRSYGSFDIFLLKLDGNGNFKWVKQFGGVVQDNGNDLWFDDFNNIYVTGQFEGVADFDLGGGQFMMTSAGGKDMFLVKMSLCENPSVFIITENVCNSFTLNGQTYTETGLYHQYLENTLRCDSIITLNLTINRKFTSLNPSICEGQFYYAAGANQTVSGIYNDTLISSIGCDSVVITNLTVHPKPVPNLGADRNICQNATTSITPGIFKSYLWHDNSTQANFLINSIGKYWVTVTDTNNCIAADTLNILSIDSIPGNFLPADDEICFGSTLKISVPGYIEYLWSDFSRADFYMVRNAGIYHLKVKDLNNCIGIDTIFIRQANCIPIGIPNAFTPNGDGNNDIFKPTINQSIQSFSFIVFNRYGQKVFETREYGKGWDGKLKGKDQPAGSYVYRIDFTNNFGWKSENNGSVLLIR